MTQLLDDEDEFVPEDEDSDLPDCPCRARVTPISNATSQTYY